MPNAPTKILIVDDDPGLLAVLEASLRVQEEYDVQTSINADDALAKLEAQDFDLVVTDYSLNHPRYNGLDILRRARKSPATLVIIITAFASLEITLESIHLGAYDFLTKPFQLDELQLVVRNAAEHVRLERENGDLRRQITELVATLEEIEQHYGKLLEKVSQWDHETGPQPAGAARMSGTGGTAGTINEYQAQALRRRHMQDQIATYVRMGETLRERLARERQKIEALFRKGLLPEETYRRAMRESGAERSLP